MTAQDEKSLAKWAGQWIWLQPRTQDTTIILNTPSTAGSLTGHGTAGLVLEAGKAYPFYVPQKNTLSLYTFGAAADTLDILGP